MIEVLRRIDLRVVFVRPFHRFAHCAHTRVGFSLRFSGTDTIECSLQPLSHDILYTPRNFLVVLPSYKLIRSKSEHAVTFILNEMLTIDAPWTYIGTEQLPNIPSLVATLAYRTYL